MSINMENIRNIAICGHSSTGKTTFTEQLLYLGGSIAKPEKVQSGKTVSDFADEEIAQQISIHTTCSHLNWQDKKVNILDTPGASDFIGEVTAAFRAAESALLLVGADVGVQIGTINLWRQLDRHALPRMIFLNKMDKEHADFNKSIEDLKEKFKTAFIPVMMPIGQATAFKGVIDLIDRKAYLSQNDKVIEGDIPEELKAQAEEYRQKLIETAAEGDDALMERFFEEDTLSTEEINRGLALAFKEQKIIPVLCGASLSNAGLTSFLNLATSIAPAPGGEVPAQNESGEDVACAFDSEAPLSCFVFKTSIDQFSGKLSFIKVISGKITADSELINAREEKKEKINKIFTCRGKTLEEVEGLSAGDIGILSKLNIAATNDTLCNPNNIVRFKNLMLPPPVHSVAISALAKKDEDKLNQLLQRAAEEDPTFSLHYNRETRETVISGRGELHLNIILGKIKDHHKIEMETKVPRVAFRETINGNADAEYLHKKQSGGHGQYAKVMLAIKPLKGGEHFKFVNATVGGSISKGYIPGVEKGIIEAMASGILAGYPVTEIEASVIDGKEHSVDSSEMAFKLAARGALRAAMEKAKPVLLEPVMNLNVFVDNKYLGDVLSDLSSRRGRVLGQEPMGGEIQEIKAQVPQSELLRYSIDLRSITSGTASFEMEFDHYSPISGKAADDVIKAAKAQKDEG
ncbi:MAG: elongation factor G [Spirochaeta sp.]|nr:elongation factor G [Spirochaeta sp.]